MERKIIENLIIDGKRWFQKTYGNTYHSVKVIVNGKSLGNSGIHYGYGNQYLQTACEMLVKENYFIDYDDFNNWRRNTCGKAFIYITVNDVNREKDLK
jgi:hypothetical protein